MKPVLLFLVAIAVASRLADSLDYKRTERDVWDQTNEMLKVSELFEKDVRDKAKSQEHQRTERGLRDKVNKFLKGDKAYGKSTAANNHHQLIHMTTPEMIIATGYPAEIHHVTTEDGYILELHRIPHSFNETKSSRQRRPAVFLHHGILLSSADFIMNDPPQKALAYLLADNGYDVWLANARGNTYSKNHVRLSPSTEEFWEFSWHEMGYYDLPAAIDYVLAKSGEKALSYVGYSMGTTAFWVLMSERPEYASKVKFMAAMAPVAYMENMKGPVRAGSWFGSAILKAMGLLGQNKVFSFGHTLDSLMNPFMDYLVSFFCNKERYTSAICYNGLFLISGSNPDQLNKEMLPVILAHTPSSTSTRTVLHYRQEVKSGYFRRYDFGSKANMVVYAQPEPPSYQLELVTPPVALFWSRNDWIATPADILHLKTRLPNVVYTKMIDDAKFTHLDFVWAMTADTLLYHPILDLLSKYQD